MQKFDAIIVGASFAGLSCAKELLKSNLRVLILEAKSDLEKRIHTTGIIVDEAHREWLPDHNFVHAINKVVLYAPSLRNINIESKDYKFYTTDTGPLIKNYAANLLSKGLIIQHSYSFQNVFDDGHDFIIEDLNVKSPLIIGADGARSTVAKYFNLGKNHRYLHGLEYEFFKDTYKLDAFHCFLNQDIHRGYLGWVIPGVQSIQVGFASYNKDKLNINKFLKSISPMFPLNPKEKIAVRSGVIPVNGVVHPLEIKNRVFLIGDAAGTVSPITGGGIHTAMRYGRILGQEITRFHHNKTHYISYKKYLPSFRLKRGISYLYVHMCPNWLIELTFRFKMIVPIAKIAFFLRKSLK